MVHHALQLPVRLLEPCFVGPRGLIHRVYQPRDPTESGPNTTGRDENREVEVKRDHFQQLRTAIRNWDTFTAADHVRIDPSEVWKLREIAARARVRLEALS